MVTGRRVLWSLALRTGWPGDVGRYRGELLRVAATRRDEDVFLPDQWYRLCDFGIWRLGLGALGWWRLQRYPGRGMIPPPFTVRRHPGDSHCGVLFQPIDWLGFDGVRMLHKIRQPSSTWAVLKELGRCWIATCFNCQEVVDVEDRKSLSTSMYKQLAFNVETGQLKPRAVLDEQHGGCSRTWARRQLRLPNIFGCPSLH